jgi:putative spermidine/putrescine transport system substrate-binding protein
MAERLAGGDERNIDPGFRKLAQLKPNLGAIYTNSSQCQQLFEQGGTWIAPWYSGRVASTVRSGVPVKAAVTKEGEPVYLTMLCPLKGRWSPWVAKFMEMHLAADVQQAFAKEFASGPSRTDVKLDPEVAKNVPYGADQVSRLIQFDWDAVIPHLDEWTQRFNREIAS